MCAWGYTVRFLMLLYVCALLTACGKPVNVIEADQFKRMADRMPAELEARGLIDSARQYQPAIGSSGRDEYGATLYARLVPDCVLEDTARTAQTFAATLTPRQSVTLRSTGFSITETPQAATHTKSRTKRSTGVSIAEARRGLHVDMVAIADWDNDGTDDWIIAATVERAKLVQRVFYAVIFNPQDEGALRGTPIAVYEDLGITGRLYMRDAKAPQTQTAVEETVPGLRRVTEPPEKNPARNSAGSVKERSL